MGNALPGSIPTFQDGFRMENGGKIQNLSDLVSSTQTAAITALAGGARSASTPVLQAALNIIGTVASSGDSVILPAAVPGYSITVANAGANPAQVFAAGTDTINGTAGSTGISLVNAKNAVFFCPIAGKWFQVLTA